MVQADTETGEGSNQIDHECKIIKSMHCSICGIKLNNDNAYTNLKKGPGCYWDWCKECRRDKNKQRYIQKRNHILEQVSIRRNKKREEINDNYNKWYLSNRIKKIQQCCQYASNNKQKKKIWSANRRAFKNKVINTKTINYQNIQDLMQKQKCSCVYCGDNIASRYEIDHIIPLSRLGGNTIENCQLLCKSCNCSKGTKTHEEYLTFKERRI